MPVVEANGIQVYYEERGAGDPLVMIMGITARGAVWEKHAEYWQQDFRCILPDNRGVGLTDKPAGPYTSAQMADDYAALMQELGIERARVIGCSMGSIIAQQLALRHPARVRSLVLMCTWARCDRYARDVFQHIIDIKSRLRPEEFATVHPAFDFCQAVLGQRCGIHGNARRPRHARSVAAACAWPGGSGGSLYGSQHAG